MIHQGTNISHQTVKGCKRKKSSPQRCLLHIWTRSVKGGYPPNIPPFNITTLRFRGSRSNRPPSWQCRADFPQSPGSVELSRDSCPPWGWCIHPSEDDASTNGIFTCWYGRSDAFHQNDFWENTSYCYIVKNDGKIMNGSWSPSKLLLVC